MDLGFRGEVADFYRRFRRDYPPAVIDSLVGAFGLTTDNVVVDLGCGTGQLTLPIAERVRPVPKGRALEGPVDQGAGRGRRTAVSW